MRFAKQVRKAEMTTPKYKITEAHLTTPGGVAKLERDGHNRHTIHDAMFKIMDKASHQEQTKVMSKLFDREKPC